MDFTYDFDNYKREYLLDPYAPRELIARRDYERGVWARAPHKPGTYEHGNRVMGVVGFTLAGSFIMLFPAALIFDSWLAYFIMEALYLGFVAWFFRKVTRMWLAGVRLRQDRRRLRPYVYSLHKLQTQQREIFTDASKHIRSLPSEVAEVLTPVWESLLSASAVLEKCPADEATLESAQKRTEGLEQLAATQLAYVRDQDRRQRYHSTDPARKQVAAALTTDLALMEDAHRRLRQLHSEES